MRPARSRCSSTAAGRVTTFQGATDYYNSKPPLNVWLIVASFQAFGVGLVALRLPAVICAWLTVAATMWWSRRAFGDRVALLATLVLATTYGFLYVHSGRTANADAPMTLAVTLTAITVWAARGAPWLMPGPARSPPRRRCSRARRRSGILRRSSR